MTMTHSQLDADELCVNGQLPPPHLPHQPPQEKSDSIFSFWYPICPPRTYPTKNVKHADSEARRPGDGRISRNLRTRSTPALGSGSVQQARRGGGLGFFFGTRHAVHLKKMQGLSISLSDELALHDFRIRCGVMLKYSAGTRGFFLKENAQKARKWPLDPSCSGIVHTNHLCEACFPGRPRLRHCRWPPLASWLLLTGIWSCASAGAECLQQWRQVGWLFPRYQPGLQGECRLGNPRRHLPAEQQCIGWLCHYPWAGHPRRRRVGSVF